MTTEPAAALLRLVSELESEAKSAIAAATDVNTLDAARREFFSPGSGRFRNLLRSAMALDVTERQAVTDRLNAVVAKVGDCLQAAKRRLDIGAFNGAVH